MSGPTSVHKLLEPSVSRFLNGTDSVSTLKECITAVIQEQSVIAVSQITFSNLLNKFVSSGLDLINYSDSKEIKFKLAGIAVFDSLLEFQDEIKPERRIELANHLCKILEVDKLSLDVIQVVLQAAAQSIGHFVRNASTNEMDFFGGYSFQLGLKLLGNSRSESRRYAGSLIMSELAHNAPTLIFSKRKSLFDVIWNLICDKNAVVRDAIADTIEVALQVVSQREGMAEFITQAFRQINAGFSGTNTEKNLGSLMIIEIIAGGAVTNAELQTSIREQGEHAHDIIWKIMIRKDYKDDIVRNKVIEILPTLCAAFPASFVQHNAYTRPNNFLVYTIKFLITTIHAKKLRGAAYLALGKLYLTMANQMRTLSLVEDIFFTINAGLREPFCIEALQCLGMIVTVSVPIRRYIDDQLMDAIFTAELTPELLENVKLLAKYVPAIRSITQDYLRKHVSRILSKYRVLVDEPRNKQPDQRLVQTVLKKSRGSIVSSAALGRETMSARPVSMMNWGGAGGIWGAPKHESASAATTPAGAKPSSWRDPVQEIKFALNILTLQEFFPKLHTRERASTIATMTSGNSATNVRLTPPMYDPTTAGRANSAGGDTDEISVDLLKTARQCVVCYLDDYDPAIRGAAARACVAVLDSTVLLVNPISEHFDSLQHILDRLLLLGVGDDCRENRELVFKSLDPSLDHVISLTDSVHCLIEALSDECLEVRAAALTVIARVAHFDALHVMPVVQLTMKRLLLTLSNSATDLIKRESVVLLQALVNGANSLIVPYVHQVLHPLLMLLKDSSEEVVVAVLSSIGDLAVASPDSVRTHLHVLSPRLIEALNDESSVQKQEVAVVAMGKLVSSLTIVVTEDPYRKYKGLFEGLVRSIRSKDISSAELRLQAIRTVGLLGFVDVDTYQQHLNAYKTDRGIFQIDSEELVASDAVAAGAAAGAGAGCGRAVEDEYQDELKDEDETDIAFPRAALAVAAPARGASARNNQLVQNSDSGNIAGNDAAAATPRLSKLEKSCLAVVIKELTNILRDSSLHQYHHTTSTVAVRVTKIIGKQASQVSSKINQLVDSILFRLYQPDSSAHIRETMLEHVVTIIYNVGSVVRPRLQPLIAVVADLADTHMQHCVDVIEALSTATSTAQFYFVLKSTLPVLLNAVKEEMSYTLFLSKLSDGIDGPKNSPNPIPTRYTSRSGSLTGTTGSTGKLVSTSTSAAAAAAAAVVERNRSLSSVPAFHKSSLVLQLLNSLSDVLGEFRRDLIAFIVRIFDCRDATVTILKEALSTVMRLANDTDLQEFSSRIIHPLLRVLPRADVTLQSAILTAFSTLLCRLGSGYVPYVVPVRRQIRNLSTTGGSSNSSSSSSSGAVAGGNNGSSSTGNNYATQSPSSKLAARIDEYDALVNRLLKQRPLPPRPSDTSDLHVSSSITNRVVNRSIAAKRPENEKEFHLGIQALETAWALAGRNNASDLEKWMQRLSIELIRQSPSPVIRACAELAKSHRPLASDLFKISFHCVWNELFIEEQNDVIENVPLIDGIEMALQSPHLPKSIMVPLLNLAEHMEMQDRRLPVDIRLLARQARKANMFAKCLHYRGLEFHSPTVPPTSECVDDLISVNTELNLPDRAIGLLRLLKQRYPAMEIQPNWLEKLNRWDDARRLYESECEAFAQKYVGEPVPKHAPWLKSEMGRLRCLHGLGEYDALESSVRRLKDQFKSTEVVGVDEEALLEAQSEMQRLGANAAWMLGKWDSMDDILEGEDEGEETTEVVLDQHVSFYRAVMAIHKHEYDKAQDLIEDTRSRLAGSIGALLSENYSRAYRAMVSMQVLAEMEEVVEYKQTVERANLELEALQNNSIASDHYLMPHGTRFDSPTIESMAAAGSTNSLYRGEPSGGDRASNGNGSGGMTPVVHGTIDVVAKKFNLIQKWRGRLKWAPTEVDVYRQILEVHTLVTEPLEDLDSWLELVTLCRKRHMHFLCENILRKLGAPIPPRQAQAQASGSGLQSLVQRGSKELDRQLGSNSGDAALNGADSGPAIVVVGDDDVDEKEVPPPPPSFSSEGTTNVQVTSKEYPAIDFNGKTNDRVLLSTFEYWWGTGEKQRALRELTRFLAQRDSQDRLSYSTRRYSTQDATLFRVECLLKRAEWLRKLDASSAVGACGSATTTGSAATATNSATAATVATSGGINGAVGGVTPSGSPYSSHESEAMKALLEARELAGDRYSVWHAWAVANYDHVRRAEAKESAGGRKGGNGGGGGGGGMNGGVVDSFGGVEISRIKSQSRDSPERWDASISIASTGPRDGSPATEGGKHGRRKDLSDMGIAHIGTGGNRHSKRQGGGGGGGGGGVDFAAKQKRGSGSASLLSLLTAQQVDTVTPFIIEAIKGFVKSIILGFGQPTANVLQDTLRLITLWFSYGTKRGVSQILDIELDKVSPDNWLEVLPQLIARIHIKGKEISGLMRKLLTKVATSHPQALVCPISVALNTQDTQQRMVASEVLHEMRKVEGGSQLVQEATMVSRELMRVAITPHELWYDGLEQAAQLYMEAQGSQGIILMLSVLAELHDAMSEADAPGTSSAGTATSVGTAGTASVSTAQEGFADRIGKIGRATLRDVSFRQCYGKSLKEAKSWLDQFHITGSTLDLHQAWEIYQQVFKRIKTQIMTLKRLELHHVSPDLTSARNLSLVVPGTYRQTSQDIGIRSFSPFFEVIASKQRPRRMSMLGSDGKKYEFLLKGHEDLRQDERVMQLFGLINTCLNNDNVTNTRGLEIVRYSVLPLSNNSGVIGWVQNCDTINSLVKQYREVKDIKLLLEVKLLHSRTLNYDKLPVLHKVDLFRQVQEETTGQDLAKMLWLKSGSADIWLERRANFTKSMATMSMVGYILGLGDRHPSNLMVAQKSGRVVHIDFGDCFEITKTRSKYPEIIPFRLTRMLTNGMGGPASLLGSYKMDCERVMRVLRDNRDSVMAMLEAFVYDPLISWRLLTSGDGSGIAAPDGAGTGAISRADTSKVTADGTGDDGGGGGKGLGGAREGVESDGTGGEADRFIPISSSVLDGGTHGAARLTSTMAAMIGRDGAGGGAGGEGRIGGSTLRNGGAAAAALDNVAMSFSRRPPMPVTGSVLDRAASLRYNIAPLGPSGAGNANAPEDEPLQENLNARALEVINRIQAKLTGRDFVDTEEEDLTVEEQVELLIEEATSVENLCQLFTGWCPLW